MERYWKPLFAVSIAAALLLGGVAMAHARRADELNDQVQAYASRAVYEGAEMMRGVESNLRKLAVSGSGVQMQQYLGDIARQAQGAESAVAALPLSSDHVQTASRAINQMGDYAAVLSNRLSRGGAVTQEDIANIDKMISASTAINAALQRMVEGIEAGEELVTLSLGPMPEAGNINEEDGEYPTLIYDGPFSDVAQGGPFLGLTGNDVTPEQAEQKLRAYIGDDRITSVELVRQSELSVPVYEFAVRSGDMAMSAAVTRQGGHVLYILPESTVPSGSVPAPECVAAAAQFLDRNGYDDMQVSYYYHYQNVVTVNFAAQQGDVLLYPDLIKVQVSMQDGKIIGVECENYLRNHVQRKLSEVEISKDDALQRLNSNLQPQFIRMALIPLNTQEILTYEIAAKDDYANQYLIYIDAVNGQERQIYQLLIDENGTLTE